MGDVGTDTDDRLKRVADKLGMTEAELDRVVHLWGVETERHSQRRKYTSEERRHLRGIS